MEDQNTGSFGAPLGGIDALKQAMQRRGISIPAIEQMSASAPGEQVAPPSISEAPQVGNIESQVAGQVEEPEQKFRSAEMDTALNALAKVATTESDIAKNALKLRSGGVI